MPDTKDAKLRFTTLREEDFHDRFFSRAELAARWGCSEKAVLRAEKRLGLSPHRLLRAVKYKLSEIVAIEAQARDKMPKKFTGLRRYQKFELAQRQREELNEPASAHNP